MANPVLGNCNVVGNVLTGADLGLSAGTFLATASPKDLTAIHSAVPETYIVLCRLSSGSATLTVDLTADGVYSSADASVSLTGTNMFALVVDTTTSLTYANVRLATSANCIVDRFAVLPLCKLTAGENFASVLLGRNAVASQNMTKDSDGSGVFSISVSA